MGCQLYLPEEWCKTPCVARRRGFRIGWRFAPRQSLNLEQIDAALAAGIPRGVVLADAAYQEAACP
ncbi:transposase [Rhodanobacter sp. 115]|uniref:transposase n=1 Tax=Rhodanobacter sp. FW021-MT20 TaxID=1162282 RepID=UPI0034E5E681